MRDFPPNSGETTPTTGGLGLDTLAVRGPTSEELLDLLHHQRFELCADTSSGATLTQLGGHAELDVGRSRVRISADRRLGRPEVRVEFSAPKLAGGHNFTTLPLSMLADAAEVVLTRVGRDLPGLPDMQVCRPTRIDLAYDFVGISFPSLTLASLAARPLPWVRGRHEYRGADGLLESVTWRGRGWRVVAYDKAAQLAQQALREPSRRDVHLSWAHAAEGQLRIECQIRTGELHKHGCRTIADATPERLTAIACHFLIARCRLNELRSGSERLGDWMRQMAAEGKTGEARGLLAYLNGEAFGVPLQGTTTRDKYKKLARKLNLSSGDLTSGQTTPARLDFSAARELLGDEALGPYRPGILAVHSLPAFSSL